MRLRGWAEGVNVHTSTVKAVLAGDGLPEGGTDLVTLFLVVRRVLELNWSSVLVGIHIGRSGGGPVGERR